MAVSVLIVTRNRPEFLRFVLLQLAERVRTEDEVLVIDDGSEKSQGPAVGELEKRCQVHFVRHTDHAGYIARRNEGIEMASNECVLQLDDDSWPVEADALGRSEDALRDHPDVGAFALPIHYHWSQAPEGCGSLSNRWRLPHLCREIAFMGCGVILRRSAVLAAGAYPNYCRHGLEESALALRLHRIGFETRMFRRVRIIHGHDLLSTLPAYHTTRNAYSTVNLIASELAVVDDALPQPCHAIAAIALRIKALRRRCDWMEIRGLVDRHASLGRSHHRLSYPQCATWAWFAACVRGRLKWTSDPAVK